MTFSVNNENEFNPVNSLILMKYPRLNPHSFTITKATFPCIKSFHFKVVFVQTLVLFSIIFIEKKIYISALRLTYTHPHSGTEKRLRFIHNDKTYIHRFNKQSYQISLPKYFAEKPGLFMITYVVFVNASSAVTLSIV